jgi:hypothetical protein
MSTIRTRVKEHLPAVLLTLLSIVQALALEILWSRVKDAHYLYEATWAAATGWIQLSANFLGIVVIWVIYASSAMRFRWIPTTGDSVYPFLIGLGEFLLIETVRPGWIGAWFLQLALLFALMNWISHHMFRRARLEPENAEYFSRISPATLRDFYPAIATVAVLFGLGIALLVVEYGEPLATGAALAATALMLWQLYQSSVFWDRSLQQGTEEDGGR